MERHEDNKKNTGYFAVRFSLPGKFGLCRMDFAYENAKGGTVSCILTDEDGAAKYYGKLADISAAASGSLSIPLSGVADGSYLLYVFAEESSGRGDRPSPGA